MIIIKDLTKNILNQTLFKELSLILHSKEKVGLIGVNGSGKSTLMKIILGETESDQGKIEIIKERLGYLPQEIKFGKANTIEEYLGNEKRAISAMAHTGLELPVTFALTALSGGQKTKLGLAKILLQNPTFLLLDEPTNHLDNHTLIWLEKFINSFEGGVLIISHDRQLLNNTVSKIIEIDPANHKVNEYHGNYDDYADQRASRMEIWENQYQLQKREKKRLENWLVLKRQEATAHPDPAKGRKIRSMEKRVKREIYDKEITRPRNEKAFGSLQLKGQVHNGKLILRLKDVTKNFSEKTILYNASFELRGDTHTVLSGKNGSGKTTLFKIILNQTSFDTGEVRIGNNVNIGYFAQEHETLNPQNTVIEEFMKAERVQTSTDPRSILGTFLFSGNSVNKKVSSLSLGEQARLIFAILTNQQNHLLILDEPTNHLDIPSREIIEKALLAYKGAILVVSHDRYFLSKIRVDKVLELERGHITENIL